MPRPQPRHWILLGLLVIAYGSSFLLVKTALLAMSPASLVLGRLIAAFLVLAPVAAAMKLQVPTDRRVLSDLLVLALLNYAVPFALIAWGQQMVPSSIAGILMSIGPVVIIVLAHLMIPDEPLTSHKLAGFAIAFLGTMAVIGPNALAGLGGDPAMLLHQLAILGAAASYSAAAVLTKRARPVHPVVASAAVTLIATLIAAPFALPDALYEIGSAPWPALLSVFLLGAFPTGLATILYFIVIREVGASYFALTNYLVPVWATMLGITLGMEHLAPGAIAGLTLILGGITIAQRKPRNQR